MKIPSQLSQFKDKTGLILVTGTEKADFYVASNGVANKISSFVLEKIKFSDREDSVRRGGHLAFETGSEIEKVKKEERINFVKQFKGEIKKILVEQKVDLIYLFAPNTILKELEKVLDTLSKGKVKKTFVGNFCKESLVNILKKM